MKTVTAILGLVLASSAAFGACNDQQANATAKAYLNKQRKGNKVFITDAQSQPRYLGGIEVRGNLKIKFAVDGGGVMGEIGEIHLNPQTCEIVNVISDNSLSTTFEP